MRKTTRITLEECTVSTVRLVREPLATAFCDRCGSVTTAYPLDKTIQLLQTARGPVCQLIDDDVIHLIQGPDNDRRQVCGASLAALAADQFKILSPKTKEEENALQKASSDGGDRSLGNHGRLLS
jgi:hypothetical protein